MKLMTVEEVANELGISTKRVREYCRLGRLGTSWQRRWIITREEFEAFKATYTGKPGRPRKDNQES
jgi:predicted site-specific integrase-resolvase